MPSSCDCVAYFSVYGLESYFSGGVSVEVQGRVSLSPNVVDRSLRDQNPER